MSRRFTLISIGIVAVVGAVWASTSISTFPDTPEFPIYGSGKLTNILGTLGSASSWFESDGSAKNTAMLDGIPASGYLKASAPCSNPLHYWVGIDTDGNPICGYRQQPLTSIGTLTGVIGGTVNVIASGSSMAVAQYNGYLLKWGDIVTTDAGATAMIQFTGDDSILRLDASTTVELQLGLLDGNTVAQAILDNGSLWGRILSSTGVNIGGGGLVAGVRGTSVFVKKTSTASSFTLGIVDSAHNTTSPISTLQSAINAGITYPILSTGSVISYVTGTTEANKIARSQTPRATLYTDAWVQTNTLADAKYLGTLSGTVAAGTTRSSLIQKEITTLPNTVTESTLADALCGANKIFWKNLIGTSLDVCQDDKVVAIYDASFGNNIYTKSQGVIGGAMNSTLLGIDISLLNLSSYKISATYKPSITNGVLAQIFVDDNKDSTTSKLVNNANLSGPFTGKYITITTKTQQILIISQ